MEPKITYRKMVRHAGVAQQHLGLVVMHTLDLCEYEHHSQNVKSRIVCCYSPLSMSLHL